MNSYLIKKCSPKSARKHLASYLFRGEDVFKPIDGLSGGERARLALAILALEGANFLILDEPTNHLDIPARESLQDVLEAYEGTILLVSHDRYLIDRLATRVWEIRNEKLISLMEITANTFSDGRLPVLPVLQSARYCCITPLWHAITVKRPDSSARRWNNLKSVSVRRKKISSSYPAICKRLAAKASLNTCTNSATRWHRLKPNWMTC